MRVRVNSKYRYEPVPWDQLMPPVGVQSGILEPGDTVKVVNLPGCPRANTMGHCYINTTSGKFAGLVMTNSLVKP